MFDALIEGLFLVLQWKAFSLMLVGMGLGFCVGLLPGIGGAATLALMIPFVFKMAPAEAFAFLLGMHSVAATTGDITSILFGVPGEGLSAATVVDGYPMAKNGEAGRALGDRVGGAVAHPDPEDHVAELEAGAGTEGDVVDAEFEEVKDAGRK